jgi:hypothetical protein
VLLQNDDIVGPVFGLVVFDDLVPADDSNLAIELGAKGIVVLAPVHGGTSF